MEIERTMVDWAFEYPGYFSFLLFLVLWAIVRISENIKDAFRK